MCKCISTNNPQDWQTDKNVVLIPPFPSKPVGESEIPHKSVCIDFCIAEVVKHLWKNNIYTLNSCCGHNHANPSVIVQENTTNEQARKIRRLITEVDNREWDILSWKLIKF